MYLEIAGYDHKEMQKIEDELIEKYIHQDDILEIDAFVELKAPETYKEYLRKYQEESDKLVKEGIRV